MENGKYHEVPSGITPSRDQSINNLWSFLLMSGNWNLCLYKMGIVLPNVVLLLWKAPRFSRPKPNGDLVVKGTVDNVNTDQALLLSLNTKAINDMLKIRT
jgi:hypothetical protein